MQTPGSAQWSGLFTDDRRSSRGRGMLAAAVALLFCAGFLAGCGGDDEAAEETETAQSDSQPADQPDPAPQRNQPKANNQANNQPEQIQGGNPYARRSGANGGQLAPPARVKPPRSTNFASWSDEDFKDAVRERDQKVVEAIKWLGENRVNEEPAAELLNELLALSMQEPVRPPQRNNPVNRPPANNNNPPTFNGGPGDPLSNGASSGGAPVDPLSNGASSGGAPVDPLSNGASSGGGGAPADPQSNGASSGGGGDSGQSAPGLGDGMTFNDRATDELIQSAILVAGFDRYMLTSMVTFPQRGGQRGGGNPYGDGGGNPYGDGGQGQEQDPYANGQDPGGNPYGGSGSDPYGGGQEQDPYANGRDPGGNPYGGSDSDPYGSGGQNNDPYANGGDPGGNPYEGGGNPYNEGGGQQPSQPNNGAPAGPYTGSLNMNQFVQTTVDALMQVDTPGAWDTINRLLDGSQQTRLGTATTSDMVLGKLLANYRGPGHPTHTLLTRLVENPNGSSDRAMSLFTSYAASSLEQLLGSGAQAAGRQRRGAAPRFMNGGGAAPGAAGFDPSGAGASGGGGADMGAGAPGLGAGDSGAGAPGLGAGDSGAGAPGLGAGDSGAGAPGLGAGDSGAGAPGLGAPGGGLAGFNPAGAGGNNAAPANNVPRIEMSADSRQMTPEQLKRVTSFLWNPEFTQTVVNRLGQAQSLHEDPQLMALAGSLPSSGVRQAQYRLMMRHHKGGAEALENAGYFTSVARDPGLLVVLKSLPQKKRKSTTGASRTDSWNTAVKQTMFAVRSRLRQAAQKNGVVNVPRSMPVRLHKDAEPSAVFHAKWPQGVVSSLGEGKPGSMELFYVRMDLQGIRMADLKRLQSHYKRVSRGDLDQDAQESDRIYWYNGFKSTPTGGKMSVDVVFSEGAGNGPAGGAGPADPSGFGDPSGAGGGGGAAQQTGNAVLEIIVVDTPDPKQAGIGNTAAVQ